jgi:hypothetical protein
MCPTIDDPQNDEWNDRRSDRTVQIVEGILRGAAPLMRNDDSQWDHGKNQNCRDPVQQRAQRGCRLELSPPG